MKKEEAFQTLYVVEVKDWKRDPWRVMSAHEHRGDAEDAACRAIMMEMYREVRTSEWTRKEVAE